MLSLLYGSALTPVHDYWRNHSFDCTELMDFCRQSDVSVVSYAKFVLAFLPKSKCILISWQQTPSTGILEPKKVKHATIFTFSPSKGTCAVLCLVTQSYLTLCDPVDCSPPGSSVHGDSPGKKTREGSRLSSRLSSQPGNRTQVSHIAGIFFTI